MQEGENWEGKWEKRWHPLRQEWVVYAAHRNSRPWNFDIVEKIDLPEFDPGCYLCPGNFRLVATRILITKMFLFLRTTTGWECRPDLGL
jgi:galactose-1-phosphate uridylyltransferase